MKINSNIPPYAEEATINQEIEQIQEILNQFQQPIPTGFVELLEISYMCSTNPKWDKPLCERYTFLHDGNWLFLDIPHTILEKLELEKGENIPFSVWLAPGVLTKNLSFGAYPIDKEEEIFLNQPLTIDNLSQELNRICEQIQKLENDKETNQQTILNLEKELAEQEKIKKVWRDKYLTEKTTNNQLPEKNREWQDQKEYLEQTLQAVNEEMIKNGQELINSKNQVQKLLRRLAIRRIELFALNRKLNITQKQYNDLLQSPALKEVDQAQTNFAQLTNDILKLEQELMLAQTELKTIPANWKTRLTEARQKITESEREKEQVETERDDYQTKWDISLEDLKQKGEIITSYLQKIEELERKREELKKENGEQKKKLDKSLIDIRELEGKNKNLCNEIRKQEKEIKKLTKIITMFIGRTEWLEKNFLI